MKESEKYRQEAQAHKQAFKDAWSMFLKTGVLVMSVLVVLGVLSMAWFATNERVKSNTMSLAASTSANLSISVSPDALVTSTDINTKVQLVAPDTSQLSYLVPATHAWNFTEDRADLGAVNLADTSLTGLFYNTQQSAVDKVTGLQTSKLGQGGAAPAQIRLAAVPVYDPILDPSNPTTKRYYIDYTVYMAALTGTIDLGNLNAELSIVPRTSTDILDDYHYSVSADFYVKTYESTNTAVEDIVAPENYAGTLNCAKQDYKNSTLEKTYTQLDLSPKTGPVIQENKDGYIAVTMRMYFDGALKKTDGTAYVHTKDLNLYNFLVDVVFTAVDSES